MAVASLGNCWDKLSRAKEHRDSLDAHIRQTFAIESNRPSLGIKFEAQSGEYILYVIRMPDLAAAFKRAALIISDVVNNLRSILDYLVDHIALHDRRGQIVNEKALQWPIVDCIAKTWPSVVGRELKEIDPTHAAIIQRFQPENRFHDNVCVGL